ncbi:MAG: DNA mismatch repair protein MutS [Litoreibacter sp.]
MSAPNNTVTPMMAQFLEIKERYKSALLFYRMGDFYEMFFDDAIAAATALDIALTKRGKHKGADIPMCGVPVHAAENYLLTLIRKGFRVAVCEQLESPAEAKKRGYKSVVKRDVVRLVTPGTLTEDSLLEPRRNNFLAAFTRIRDDGAIAWVDISTGTLLVSPCSSVQFPPELARLRPSEVLISESFHDEVSEIVDESGAALTPLSPASFDSNSASKRLMEHFEVSSLDGFGTFTRAELSALGALLDYLSITQKDALPLLAPPVREENTKVMQIDAATRRNLELTRNLAGSSESSLLSTIDRTITSAGARLLERFVSSPTTSISALNRRLDSVQFFVDNLDTTSDIRTTLKSVPDIERALSRIAMERAGPRDLASIRNGLTHAATFSRTLGSNLPENISLALNDLENHDLLTNELTKTLTTEPPMLARDGGFVAEGFSADLDSARSLRDDGRKVIANMQAEYSSLADIPTLKIKHNNVLGYFVETSATHAEKMLAAPLSETFIHRQTTANAVRFTTVDLSEIETKILNSGRHAIELELSIFDDLREKILFHAAQIMSASKAMAEIDVYATLADIAVLENWTRPKVDNSRSFKIDGGRHPVVEQALKRQSGSPFVANSCDLSANDTANIWLLTGPNMAGKSTFLRQNAIIALLAQIGSFVPATSAHIGVISQLFSRVGASDDLARGRSTFMVEMVETAAILNQADANALVILDEIGRGTATYDGLSIAWATLEHLHEANQCRALFATHYHELTSLAGKLVGVENATVAVREWEGDVIFLHEVRKGAADRSYGVQVAKLAGLPSSVVDRARIILDKLEKSEREGVNKSVELIDDLPLFSVSTPAPVTEIKGSPANKRLDEINPDELSPREALQLLYELKDLARS